MPGANAAWLDSSQVSCGAACHGVAAVPGVMASPEPPMMPSWIGRARSEDRTRAGSQGAKGQRDRKSSPGRGAAVSIGRSCPRRGRA